MPCLRHESLKAELLGPRDALEFFRCCCATLEYCLESLQHGCAVRDILWVRFGPAAQWSARVNRGNRPSLEGRREYPVFQCQGSEGKDLNRSVVPISQWPRRVEDDETYCLSGGSAGFKQVVEHDEDFICSVILPDSVAPGAQSHVPLQKRGKKAPCLSGGMNGSLPFPYSRLCARRDTGRVAVA
jgi:hypothetical protein